MTVRPHEETKIHTRLLKRTLEIDGSRAYWGKAHPTATAIEAFENYWFGAKSMEIAEVLMTNMRARYDRFPDALYTLQRWDDMPHDTRQVICHWHLQLSDPLYRRFSSEFLVERQTNLRPEVTRDLVIKWVEQHAPKTWTLPTRIQFASKLLSSALAAGLVGTRRDPRPITRPRVPDEALEYLMYLLRGLDFEGTLLNNPYLRSVGLDANAAALRLRGLPGLTFARQGELVDFGWKFDSLKTWADARFDHADPQTRGIA